MTRVCSINNLYIATNIDPELVSRNVVNREIFNNNFLNLLNNIIHVCQSYTFYICKILYFLSLTVLNKSNSINVSNV